MDQIKTLEVETKQQREANAALLAKIAQLQEQVACLQASLENHTCRLCKQHGATDAADDANGGGDGGENATKAGEQRQSRGGRENGIGSKNTNTS